MSVDIKRLAAVQKNADYIITPRYEMWLLRHENFPVPPNIAKRLYDIMTTPPRIRAASFSASASGSCHRAQVYSFLGVPATDTVGQQLQAIFNNGAWMHMKLQCAMLMAEILTDVMHIEFPVTWRDQRTMGTMDGIGVVPDNHPHFGWRGKEFGLELKSCNSNVYRVLKDDGPDKYMRQVIRYFTLSGVELFVVFAENKDNQETLEWVFEADPALVAEDMEELRLLNRAIEKRRLPKRLPECMRLAGETFRGCAYGRNKLGVCAQITEFGDAANARDKLLQSGS